MLIAVMALILSIGSLITALLLNESLNNYRKQMEEEISAIWERIREKEV